MFLSMFGNKDNKPNKFGQTYTPDTSKETKRIFFEEAMGLQSKRPSASWLKESSSEE